MKAYFTQVFASVAIACASVGAHSGPATAAVDMEKEAVYHVFLRSFADSNGDRIGDLKGLQDKIPYLKSLGITTVLLTPLYESDFYHNYFPTDFRKIDPEFGTDSDYFNLVRALHKNGMKVIMDMEIHYVAETHQWFKDSYKNPKSPASDFMQYNGPGNTDPESGFIGITAFPTYTGKSINVYTTNLNHPATKKYHYDLFKFWVDPNGDGNFEDGVDGFRIDHMMDDLDWKKKFSGMFKDFWSPLFTQLRAINPNLKIVAEQADWLDYGAAWTTEGGADGVFAFPQRVAITTFDKEKIAKAIDETTAKTVPGKFNFTFIENHDVERFASVVEGDAGKLKVGAAFTVLLKGVPMLYYGQELGAPGRQRKDGLSDGNDISIREAMRWQADIEAPGMATWYKDTGPWWTQSSLHSANGANVESASKDPSSLLNFYKKLLKLRQATPALNSGDQRVVQNGDPRVVTFTRTKGESKVLVAVNLAAEPAKLALQGSGVALKRDLLQDVAVDVNPTSLAPYQVKVFALK